MRCTPFPEAYKVSGKFSCKRNREDERILIWQAKGGATKSSLLQAAKLPVQGKVDLTKNACIVSSKTEEVVLPGESAQTGNTAGGTTFFRPAARATYHGPAGPISLKTLHWRVFRALDAPEPLPSVAGEGIWSRQPLFLIPNPYSLIPYHLLNKLKALKTR